MHHAPAALELADVRFQWPGARAFGIKIPDFRVQTGESVLLLGESGSGKSTLLSLICGIVTPQHGSITIGGDRLSSMGPAARDRFRAENIGVIFQQFNLLPYASVRDNIQLPLRFAPTRRARAQQDEARNLTKALGLPPQVLSKPAGQLSVGQQQRVAVARALIGQPGLIVADEPTSALDASTQDRFLELMFEQLHASGAALLMVSHDERLAARFDRTVALADVASSVREVA